MKVPFVIYADFEALACNLDTCSPNPNIASTTHHTKFEACGYAYQVVCTHENYSKAPVIYRGKNVVEQFFESMFQEEDYIGNILADDEPLIMSTNTEKKFKDATNCYVCGTMISKTSSKVRDHSHIEVNELGVDMNSPDYSNFRGGTVGFITWQVIKLVLKRRRRRSMCKSARQRAFSERMRSRGGSRRLSSLRHYWMRAIFVLIITGVELNIQFYQRLRRMHDEMQNPSPVINRPPAPIPPALNGPPAPPPQAINGPPAPTLQHH
ncbi:unnamed protein product [Mytilus coruscus]|uniref:Uncharacterized protein n=1 Tax=Mytilus coruscus TaxID=42192 RepID=A0A6J8DLA9_MYTCO|nr:unnamed protein product [Mytilus coruscus]